MKPLLLYFLALGIAATAAAQGTTIGPEVGFGASRYFAAEGSPRGIAGVDETPGYAWRLGGRVNAAIGERTYLTPGLRFAYLSSRRAIDGDDLIWGSQLTGTGFDPTLPGEDIGDLLFVEQVFLVELPLEIRRYFGADARGFFVQGGLVPTYTIGLRLSDRESTSRGPLERETLQSFWLGATAALGYEWTCSDKVAFYAQAGGTVQLLEEASGSRSRRWDAGLTGGVRIALR